MNLQSFTTRKGSEESRLYEQVDLIIVWTVSCIVCLFLTLPRTEFNYDS